MSEAGSCEHLEETFQETEETLDQEATLATNTSSSPDKTIMSSPLTAGDDFKQFQDMFKKIADMLQIPLEEVAESQHKLLAILHTLAEANCQTVADRFIVQFKLEWAQHFFLATQDAFEAQPEFSQGADGRGESLSGKATVLGTAGLDKQLTEDGVSCRQYNSLLWLHDSFLTMKTCLLISPEVPPLDMLLLGSRSTVGPAGKGNCKHHIQLSLGQSRSNTKEFYISCLI
ncbi:uncharacterized protein LOC120397288 [Mauremys reevesii]|uniref:uncharacterized protein LOC120397288 n=1 Tax=Mauremys reevesii TaxID=260615 RepID=UPI00193FB91C|nr:uncharacterized protein LOC120397288 [Mauremys reevesii]